MTGLLKPFTNGNPFLGTKLLGLSIGRGSGALKGLTQNRRNEYHSCFAILYLVGFLGIPRPWLSSSQKHLLSV